MELLPRDVLNIIGFDVHQALLKSVHEELFRLLVWSDNSWYTNPPPMLLEVFNYRDICTDSFNDYHNVISRYNIPKMHDSDDDRFAATIITYDDDGNEIYTEREDTSCTVEFDLGPVGELPKRYQYSAGA